MNNYIKILSYAYPRVKFMYDIAIIGGGVTGLATAMYARRLNLNTLIISDKTGGTITLTDKVENYPGFKLLTGLELANKIKDHAMQYQPELVEERVDDIQSDGECFTLVTNGGKTFKAKTVLFATGTKHRELKVPGHDKYKNRGVHYCALCDGAFYKEKVVAIVGGSDSAAKEALVLAQNCSKVYIIYRREKLRAEPITLKQVEANDKIEVIYKTNVTEVLGDKFVTGVKLDNPYNDSDTLELNGVFIAIGLIPLSELAAKLGVKINDKGEIIINRISETSMKGVYAAGDVTDSEFKQAITGVGEGVRAAYEAFKYVNENAFVCWTMTEPEQD